MNKLPLVESQSVVTANRLRTHAHTLPSMLSEVALHTSLQHQANSWCSLLAKQEILLVMCVEIQVYATYLGLDLETVIII